MSNMRAKFIYESIVRKLHKKDNFCPKFIRKSPYG